MPPRERISSEGTEKAARGGSAKNFARRYLDKRKKMLYAGIKRNANVCVDSGFSLPPYMYAFRGCA